MARPRRSCRTGDVLTRGTLIEACSCNVNCPCWIGEDPDLGDCFAIVAYGIDAGGSGDSTSRGSTSS